MIRLAERMIAPQPPLDARIDKRLIGVAPAPRSIKPAPARSNPDATEILKALS